MNKNNSGQSHKLMAAVIILIMILALIFPSSSFAGEVTAYDAAISDFSVCFGAGK